VGTRRSRVISERRWLSAVVGIRTNAGRVAAAAVFVTSAVVGLVTNLVVGQRGWGLAAGGSALILLVAFGAVLAGVQQGAQDLAEAPAMSQEQAGMSSVTPPWGLLPDVVRGRDGLLTELGVLAAAPDGRLHVLTGLGGGGKTTVALAAAKSAETRGGTAWWISARDRPSLDSGLLDLATALGVSGDQLELARRGTGSVLDLIWERLDAAARPWVLVVDNADRPELLAAEGAATRDGNGVARGSRHGLTLVTSRYSDPEVWGTGVAVHVVDPLGVDDGAAVLVDLCGTSAGDKQDAAALARRLGGLPLALRAAGRYLRSTNARLDGVRTFKDYCADLESRFTELQGGPSVESGPRDVVMTTWETSLDLLTDRGFPEARPFMRLIGQFAPAPIPVLALEPAILGTSILFADAVVHSSWVRRHATPRRMWSGRHRLNQLITALRNLGLLDITDYKPAPRTGFRDPCPASIVCLAAHPLVVEVNAEALRGEPVMQEAVVISIVDMTAAAAAQADPGSLADAATWPLLAPHLELLAASVPRLPEDAVVRFAEAANRTAQGLRHGGDYTVALHLLIRARQAVGRLAPEHPGVLALRHSYAYVIDDLGRFSDAEAEYRSILASRIRILGAEDPLTLSTRNHLAFALSRQRRLEEAETEYRQVLDARHRLLGPDNQDTLTTRNNLANVLHGQGRYDEAETHYQNVLETQTRLLGADHLRTLITRNNLARNRSSLGRFDEAEPELRAILALRRSTRGAAHPSTLTTWHDLAVTLASQGRKADAEQEFHGVLDARRRILGENHPDTLATAEALQKITASGTFR
jgi:tetratricopeptide (TPR) repeat protein